MHHTNLYSPLKCTTEASSRARLFAGNPGHHSPWDLNRAWLYAGSISPNYYYVVSWTLLLTGMAV